ncbi:hypothetical protein M422DRAFT_165875, partial [Sphaerobolus stellatus SS14]
MESAYCLFQEKGNEEQYPPSDPKTRRWSLRDRKRIACFLLIEYGLARASTGKKSGKEYFWLDEFCLSDDNLLNSPEVESQRSYELGRLTDIFRGAAAVCVFCHIVDCDHTNLGCPWGKRLFTLGEIVHAADVVVMTRQNPDNKQMLPITNMYPLKARRFREKIQAEAAKQKRWHLYSIMQHSDNSGSVTWQQSIHAYVVEAILRDEAGNFLAHKFLGKALNGLLPRRALLQDLKGKDGWEDLAWLLELNQGFFNTASLAAVCSVADFDVQSYRWLGKPIPPKEGNERLEPIVTSFPVRLSGHNNPALCIVGPHTIPVDPWLKRNGFALLNDDELRGLK